MAVRYFVPNDDKDQPTTVVPIEGDEQLVQNYLDRGWREVTFRVVDEEPKRPKVYREVSTGYLYVDGRWVPGNDQDPVTHRTRAADHRYFVERELALAEFLEKEKAEKSAKVTEQRVAELARTIRKTSGDFTPESVARHLLEADIVKSTGETTL